MSNKNVEKIEKDMKELFYKDKELPPPYSVPMPLSPGIKTGKPRPPRDDQTTSKELFYKDQELPPTNSVPMPIGRGIKTGEPRPPRDDKYYSKIKRKFS